jgi:hypothetical protein
MLQDGTRYSKQIRLGECEKQNERLGYPGTPFFPDNPPLQLHVLQQYHDTPEQGHCGEAKTSEIVAQEFIWFGMCKDIAKYIHNCHTCQ